MTPLSPRRLLVARGFALALGALAAASLLVLGGGMIASLLGGDVADTPFFLVFVLIPGSLGSVGLLLALRRPENAVGWLLLVSGVLAGLAFASGEYVRAAAASGDLDGPLILPAAWISNTWFVPSIGLLVVYLPLLFPTGHLIGPRWRIVSVMSVFGIALGALGPATAPITIDGGPTLANPLAPPEPLLGTFQLATTISNVIAPFIFFAAVASLLIRFRRSRGVERQQIKWFLFVAAIVAAAFALSLFDVPPLSDAAWFVGLVTMALLPAAIAVAVLRYRLYEIDRIVSRAIAYTVVTVVLGATFAGVVLVAQSLLEPVTHSNAAGVAASTLVVASLFQPLRRRVQRVTDRRFNRTRYDAEREIDAFTAHVRNVVEVERVADALTTTLHETMQPTTAGVWLRREA